MSFGTLSEEGVEELLLGALAARQQLHVVEDEDVDLAEALLELPHAVASQRRDEVVHERLGGQVGDARERVALEDLVPDRVGEMCLAEADSAVDEERIVVIARLGRDGLARRVRELVRGADDEAREGVLRIEGTEEGAGAPLAVPAGGVREELSLGAHGKLGHDLPRPEDRGDARLDERKVPVLHTLEDQAIRRLEVELRGRDPNWPERPDQLVEILHAHALGDALEDAIPGAVDLGGERVTHTPIHSCS